MESWGRFWVEKIRASMYENINLSKLWFFKIEYVRFRLLKDQIGVALETIPKFAIVGGLKQIVVWVNKVECILTSHGNHENFISKSCVHMTRLFDTPQQSVWSQDQKQP